MFYKSLRDIAGASAIAICVALSSAPATAAIIDNPDDKTIQALAAYLSGQTPNFREQALKSPEYRRANEFDKPTVLADIEARFRSEYEGFATLDGLQLRVGARLGEYDAAAGVYRISAFEPGTYFPFKAGHQLILDNAPAFYEWELPVAEARKVRELSPYGNAVVELVVIPFGTAPNDKRHVRAQVVSMKLYEQRTGQLLHEMALATDQHKSVQSAAAQKPSRVDDTKVVLAGLSIGMSVDEAKAALKDAGYAIGGELRRSFRFSTYADGLEANIINTLLVSPTEEQMRFPHMAHFSLDLNCGDDAQIHSCGIVYFDPDTLTVESAALLQNAVGTSKQDIVTALFEKYGPAGDRFDAYIWRKHAIDQYVWGAFAEGLKDTHNFSDISGPKHWQVEAFIAEPTPQRKTVIVQINGIAGENAVTGGGGVKF